MLSGADVLVSERSGQSSTVADYYSPEAECKVQWGAREMKAVFARAPLDLAK